MTVKPIVTWPSPSLRQKADTVTEFNQSLEELIQDLKDTLAAHKAIGIAANQIGDTRSVCIVKVQDQDVVLVNPTIVKSSSSVSATREGCISFPDLYESIERPSEVTVSYQDVTSAMQELSLSELSAKCVQHEIDHLNGKVFLDSLSRLKKSLITKKMQKWGWI